MKEKPQNSGETKETLLQELARRREKGRQELEKAKRGIGLVPEAFPPGFSIKEERKKKEFNEYEIMAYLFGKAFQACAYFANLYNTFRLACLHNAGLRKQES